MEHFTLTMIHQYMLLYLPWTLSSRGEESDALYWPDHMTIVARQSPGTEPISDSGSWKINRSLSCLVTQFRFIFSSSETIPVSLRSSGWFDQINVHRSYEPRTARRFMQGKHLDARQIPNDFAPFGRKHLEFQACKMPLNSRRSPITHSDAILFLRFWRKRVFQHALPISLIVKCEKYAPRF